MAPPEIPPRLLDSTRGWIAARCHLVAVRMFAYALRDFIGHGFNSVVVKYETLGYRFAAWRIPARR
jgi:hypothetical protein